jgi:hypothetical protein
MFKKSKHAMVMIFFMLFSPGFWQIPSILKESSLSLYPVWQVSEFEVADINQVRGWHETRLEKAVSKISWNRPVAAGEKLIKNINLLLDPNLYFFGEHPRERLEPRSREKLLVINLPLFLWGLWLMQNQNQDKKWPLVLIGSISTFSLLGLTNNLASLIISFILLYPVTIAAIKLVQKKSSWLYLFLALNLFGITHWFVNYV